MGGALRSRTRKALGGLEHVGESSARGRELPALPPQARQGVVGMSGCTCTAEVNAKLAEHNSVIVETWYPMQRPLIETAKIDTRKRGKPTLAVASFCPFCGTKYPSDSDGSPKGRDAERGSIGEADDSAGPKGIAQ
jgi:hypothetical protein